MAITDGSALHVMLFLKNLIRASWIFNGLGSRHCQRALLVYHYPTSNAVERGNRRYRKMQSHVYRVRTQAQIRVRLALDMWREAHAEGRQHTLASLHRA